MMNIINSRQSWQTKLIGWFDEKLSWKSYIFMRWYCYHYYHLKCTKIGENFKLQWPIKKPIIRGGGNIHIGNNVTIVGQVELMANTGIYKDCEISIGDGTMIGDQCMISASKFVSIGRNCLLARYVYIYDNNGHPLSPSGRLNNEKIPSNEIAEVAIGDNVWIGHFAHIQSGVTIGDNSVIGALSVVTKSIPPNVIVMGAPARICGWLDKLFPNFEDK